MNRLLSSLWIVSLSLVLLVKEARLDREAGGFLTVLALGIFLQGLMFGLCDRGGGGVPVTGGLT